MIPAIFFIFFNFRRVGSTIQLNDAILTFDTHNLQFVNQELYSNSSILMLKVPEGALTSTTSPVFLPIRAIPIGDFMEILPS